MVVMAQVENKDHKAPEFEGENEIEKLINAVCEGHILRQHDLGKVLKDINDRIKELEIDK